MAVTGTEHHQPPLAGPALSQQLLARIKTEPTLPLGWLRPDVEAGPDVPQMPALTRCSQQQCTPFGWVRRVKHTRQNGERMPINRQLNWRDGSHTDTL